MAVSRSPGYPSMTLSEAIVLAGKLHDSNRTNPIDREAAAKDIGYSGLTGTSAKALSDLSHFGLIEKTGKGGLRVSQRAVDILYPDSATGKMAALRDAASSPALFAALQGHFHDGSPSDNSLRAYLMRQGFASAAIPHIIKSYTETTRLLQQEGASESHSVAPNLGEESATTSPPEPIMEQALAPALEPQRTSLSSSTGAAPVSSEPQKLNKINMNIRGDQVHLEGLLDYEGLIMLEKKISALKILLAVVHEANDTGQDSNSDG